MSLMKRPVLLLVAIVSLSMAPIAYAFDEGHGGGGDNGGDHGNGDHGGGNGNGGAGNLPDNQGPLQVGYVVVTPTSTNTSGLVVFETFGEHKGNTTTQAGVLPSGMTMSAMLFVTTNGRLSRNLGVAMANPDPKNNANVTLTLFDETGTALTPQKITVNAGTQTAQFVTQVFSSQSSSLADFTGTLAVVSDIPIAVVGLRFRGDNFSTIPITNLSPAAMPVISAGVGGPSAVILPQFASGGGWAAELVLANSGNAALSVRVDFFNQDGTPMTVNLNDQTLSSFSPLAIPPHGVTVLAARDAEGDDDF
jgi:hypothetical protein